MDTNITIALITASITSVTGIISSLVNTFFEHRLEYNSNEIKKQQLLNVFAPMDKTLRLSKTPTQQLVLLRSIIERHYELIPPEILSAYIRYENDQMKSELVNHSFSELVATCYEFSRKSLGYPYDEKRIKYTLIPGFRKKTKQSRLLLIAADLVISISCALHLSGTMSSLGLSETAIDLTSIVTFLFSAIILACHLQLTYRTRIHNAMRMAHKEPTIEMVRNTERIKP